MSSAVTRHEIRVQVTSIDDLNHRIIGECFQKCVPKPRDGDMSVGEMACIDRCVPKYLATHALVGKELAAMRTVAPPVTS